MKPACHDMQGRMADHPAVVRLRWGQGLPVGGRVLSTPAEQRVVEAPGAEGPWP
jgi:hypothetical protein